MTYEFKCPECGVTEEFHGTLTTLSYLTPVCAVCDGKITMQRVFTPPGIVFKGKGWASKDD